MCMPMTCNACKKASWTGCGAHVEQVLGNVPQDERCKCREEMAAAKANQADAPKGRGFWSRLSGQ